MGQDATGSESTLLRELPWDQRGLGLPWKGYRVVSLVKQSTGVEKPPVSQARSTGRHTGIWAGLDLSRLKVCRSPGKWSCLCSWPTHLDGYKR